MQSTILCKSLNILRSCQRSPARAGYYLLSTDPVPVAALAHTTQFAACSKRGRSVYKHQRNEAALPRRLASAASAEKSAALDQGSTGVSLSAEPFHLSGWRSDLIDLRWHWGPADAQQEENTSKRLSLSEEHTLPGSLAECAVKVLTTAAPEQKIAWTHNSWRRLTGSSMPIGWAEPPDEPARPERPIRLPSKQIPKAKQSGLPLNVYQLHILAHIELNAIDLAWDTVARFSGAGLPKEFYADFAHIAEDESRHLGWCLQRLEELGYAYGDMPAHNMLWEGSQASAGHVLGRLVVVPCSQEARGLDAGPRLVERLMSIPDHRTAAIVDRIAKEEMAHVSVGTFWFREICKAMSRDSGDTFREWLAALCPDLLSGNFNHDARARAGLERSWYEITRYPLGDLRISYVESKMSPPGFNTPEVSPPIDLYDGRAWPQGTLPAASQNSRSRTALELPVGLQDMSQSELGNLFRRMTQVLDLEATIS